jgi:hypothetical protein
MTLFSISSTRSCFKWIWRVQVSSRLGWSLVTLPFLLATKRCLRTLRHTLTTAQSTNSNKTSMSSFLILWCTLNSQLLSPGWRRLMIFWYWFLTWTSTTLLMAWDVNRLKSKKMTDLLAGAMSILTHSTNGLTRRVTTATTEIDSLSWSPTSSTRCSLPLQMTNLKTRKILTKKTR